MKLFYSILILGSFWVSAGDSVNFADLVMDQNLGEQSRLIDYYFKICGNTDDRPPSTCKSCEEKYGYFRSSGLNKDLCPIELGEQLTDVSKGAQIDNGTFSYNQIQGDGSFGGGFGSSQMGGSGSCCGGGMSLGGAGASLMNRHFTSRKGGLVGDFGLDQTSSYDFKLRLMTDANNKLIADLDSPDSNFSKRLVDGRDGDTMDGHFHDQLNGVVSELILLDANNQPTTDYALADRAELYTLDREVFHFEIVQMGTDYVGRLTAIKDKSGYGIDIDYKDQQGLFTATELADSPELQWQRHTVTDATNRVTTFEYSTDTIAGNYVVSKVILPNGKDIVYNYNQDNLSQVDFPDGRKSVYSYSVQGNFTHFIASEVSGETKEVIMSNNMVGSIGGTDGITSHGVEIWNQSSLLAKTASVNNEIRYHIMMNQVAPYNLRTVYEGKGKLTKIHNGWWAKQFNGTVNIPENGAGWNYSNVTGSTEGKFAKWKGYPHGQLYKKAPSTLYDDQGVQYFYEYTDRNAVTKKTYPDGSFEAWEYNEFRQVERYRDRLGQVTKNSYDTRGNLVSKEVGLLEVAGVDQPTTEYAAYNKEYYPANHANEYLLRYEWDANGNRTEYIYNSDNLVVTVNEPNDVLTNTTDLEAPENFHVKALFTYEAGRIKTSTDAVSRTTTFFYDDRERLVSKTYHDTSTELFIYGSTDATGDLLVKFKDRNGNVTKYEYDNAGRRVKTITAYSTMGKDGTGEQLVTNGSSSTQDCTYIAGTFLKDSCTTDGDRVEYNYDFRRRRVGTTRYPLAGVSLTTNSKYINNLLFESTDAYGRKTYYSYRASDSALVRTVKGTMPSFSLASFTAVNNLTRDQSDNAAYLITDYDLDFEGQAVEVTDPKGVIHITFYDSRGRTVLAIKDFGSGKLNQTAETLYDANSNVLEVRNPRYFSESISDVVRNSYSRRNLRESRTVAFGSLTVEAEESWTYYNDSRLESHTDFRGKTTITEWHQCCGRFQAGIDPNGHAAVSNNDFYGNVTHTAVLEGYVTADMGGTANQSEHNFTNNKTMQEITTRFDERHRPIAKTVWKDKLGDVQANDVPISTDPGVTETGLTTRYFYYDEVVDPLNQTVYAELAPLIDEAKADLLLTELFDENCDGSAVISINGEGEVAVSIQDGVGRTIATGMYDRLEWEQGNFVLKTWSTQTFDVVSSAGLLEVTSTTARNYKNTVRSDGAGRALEVEDAENRLSKFKYDANSNRVSALDANGVGQICVFDNLNRDTTCTDTYGDITSREFDLNNNVVVATDAKGNTSTVVYDERNRTSSKTDRIGGVTSYEYDANNNTIAIWDANQLANAYTNYEFATRYKYDDRNLVIETAYPGHPATGDEADSYIDLTTAVSDSAYDKTSCSYDALRRKGVYTDQKGDTISYVYDLASRLEARAYYTDGVTLESTDTFGYDDASRLKTAVKGRYGNTVNVTYDPIGRKHTESVALGAGTPYEVETLYDNDNRVIDIKYPAGNHVIHGWTDRNQLEDVDFKDTSEIQVDVVDFEYDFGGRENKRTFANGLIATKAFRDDTTGKDNMLESIAIAGKADLSFDYTYDPNKNVVSENSATGSVMNDYSWDTTKADLSSGFDANDRVTNWERENGDKQGWDLDLIGNWGNTTGTLDGNAFDEDREHNDVNEVTDIDGNSVVYDAKGNMTNDAWLNSLSWDIDNHLQSHNSVTFTYDALGRRLEKKTSTGNTLFICNGQRVVEEYTDDLVNGYQLARSYVYGSYIDDVVAKIEGGSTHYYHTDRQFNVRGITDSTGAVVELYAYSVYGKQTVMDSAGIVQIGSAVNNFYGYTGRYLDSETGLWYFRARYFSDEMGRFINRDPLGYVDGMSLYQGYFAEGFNLDPSGTQDGGSYDSFHDYVSEYRTKPWQETVGNVIFKDVVKTESETLPKVENCKKKGDVYNQVFFDKNDIRISENAQTEKLKVGASVTTSAVRTVANVVLDTDKVSIRYGTTNIQYHTRKVTEYEVFEGPGGITKKEPRKMRWVLVYDVKKYLKKWVCTCLNQNYRWVSTSEKYDLGYVKWAAHRITTAKRINLPKTIVK